MLQDGTRGWEAAGLALFAGVNLPSKTFGELAEQAYDTPHISALELAAMIAGGEDLVVLDGRPVSEFRKMNIPTASCCPNGELALRVRQLVPNDSTRIVINCAGRTRSIIGAQTLINLGLPNPVCALKDGTQGWFLQDLPLEHGTTRQYGEPAGQQDMRAAALALAQRFGVAEVDAVTVRGWAGDSGRSLFLCDVRTPEEFAAGTLPGAQHTPGGQLLQACDQFVGVRNARIVLFDSDGIRAPTVASWLRQMGHDASVLAGGLASGLSLPAPQGVDAPPVPRIDAATLARQLAAGEAIAIDLRASMQYRQAHIPGSQWSIRTQLAAQLAGERRPVVLIVDDAAVTAGAVFELQSLGLSPSLLAGGVAAWQAAGLALESSAASPPDAECIDFLFFVHDRHDGNKDAARAYLAWETGLVARLDERERAAFRLPGRPQA